MTQVHWPQVQWLLIGGPAHGKTLWVKAGSQLRYPGADCEDYLYVGHTFVHDGKAYRIGVCHSEDGDRYSDLEIAALVESTRLAPVAAQ